MPSGAQCLMGPINATASDNRCDVSLNGGALTPVTVTAAIYDTIEELVKTWQNAINATVGTGFTASIAADSDGRGCKVTLAHSTHNFYMHFATDGIGVHLGFDNLLYTTPARSFTGESNPESTLVVTGLTYDDCGFQALAQESYTTFSGSIGVAFSSSVPRKEIQLSYLNPTQWAGLLECVDNAWEYSDSILYMAEYWTPTPETDAANAREKLRIDYASTPSIVADKQNEAGNLYSTRLIAIIE